MIDAAHDEWLTDGVLGRRFVAWLIDAVLIAVLLVVLKIVLITFGVLTLGLGLPLLGLLPFVPIAYVLGFLLSERGATPGQLATGIVLRRNDDFGRPTGVQALIWTVGLALTMIAGAFWILVSLVTVRHRALHDLASGLVVARADTIAPRTGIWTMPTRSGPNRSGRPFA